MTLQDLGSIGELVGAIATVATLIYLAIQIRSNTLALRSTAAQSVHESFATWYRMLAGDEGLSELMAKGLRDYSLLSETERARFAMIDREDRIPAQAAVSPISLTLQGRDIAICGLDGRFHQRSRAVADESPEFRASL